MSARFFAPIVEHLGRAGLLEEKDDHFRRLVIEKPFGTDLASAKDLNQRILKYAQETQVYRIDHFLGKDTVQSILAVRFANAMFEPIAPQIHRQRADYGGGNHRRRRARRVL